MVVTSTIPEPVVTIALRLARQVPPGRNPHDHLECVYANFCDYFRSWDDFVAKVRAFRGRIDR
jgi:hypothetical protein